MCLYYFYLTKKVKHDYASRLCFLTDTCNGLANYLFFILSQQFELKNVEQESKIIIRQQERGPRVYGLPW